MRRAAALLVVALSTFSAAAQETFFSETIDVRVINVDAIVTDKKGAPVAGLTKDDFEILENGTPKEVTNFYEYRGLPSGSGVTQPQAAAPATADLRPRRIVLFIDDESLNPLNRNRVFPEMKDFVKTSLRPGDAVMIARWKPGLEFSLELTGDASVALAKLDELAGAGAQGATRKSELETIRDQMFSSAIANQRSGPRGTEMKSSIDEGVERARMYAAKMLTDQHRKTEAIRSLLGSLRGIEGRKILVLLSESMSEQPGRASFDFLYLIRDQYEGGSSYVPEIPVAEYADDRLVPMLSEAANSAGVTLYPVDAGGLASIFDDMAPDAGGSAAALSVGYRKESSDAKMAALRGIASATGGVATTLSNNFKLAFTAIANDLNSYYSLGYRADTQRQDAVRSIDVRLKKKGYTVRTRNSFVEKSVTAEMSDAVAANLFYRVEKNDLKIAMTAGTRVAAGETATVPVTITIPTASLTLLPDGSDLTGRFSTYAAFVRHDGVVSQVKNQTHQLRFPAASLSRRKEITLKLDVTVDNVTDGLSVGVMDDVSRATGFATIRM